MSVDNLKHKGIIALLGIVSITVLSVPIMLMNGGFSLHSLKSALFPILLAGFFVGIVLPYVLIKIRPFLENQVRYPALYKGENIVFEGKANIFKNRRIATGGKLFLTNKRLIFIAHKYNFQSDGKTIDLLNISSIQERKTALLVDNGLRVKTTENTVFDFVVDQRNEWTARLKAMCVNSTLKSRSSKK